MNTVCGSKMRRFRGTRHPPDRPDDAAARRTGRLARHLRRELAGGARALPRPTAVKAEVAREVEPELRDADGIWTADYVRLRFAADKPR